jgi:tetratricopeptide (TPR) repeat protein
MRLFRQILYQGSFMKSRSIGTLTVLLLFFVASAVYGADLCREYMKKGDYDNAIRACTETIALHGPGTFLAYDNRGFAYSKKGDYDKAISDFTKAIELNPRDVYAYDNRSFAYSKKGQYDKALSDSAKSIELQPGNALTYQTRALVYEGARQNDKALADWDKAIELSPGEYTYLSRARLYREMGHYDEAIADYGRLIRQEPAKPAGYWFRAAAYYEKGQFEDSVRDYRKLMELFKKDHPLMKLDLLYIRLLDATAKLSKDDYGKIKEELRGYVASSTVSSDDEQWWRTVSKYYLGTDGLTAAALADEARNSRTEKEAQRRLCSAYYSIGEKKLAEGNRRAAEEFFRKSIEIETDRSSFSYRYAKAMLTLMKEGKI